MVNVVALLPHPSTSSEAIESLDVQVSMGHGLLTLRYDLRADMSRIRIGSETVPGRADGLWRHTSFEAFIRLGRSPGYWELNFSPTRQWAAYAFDGYREGMRPLDLSSTPEILIRKAPHSLQLQATFPMPARPVLPASVATGAAPGWALGLTAVVEEDNGRLCYWSARHPQGKPDFHHADNFALELQEPQ
jgi:hypothetical protein